MESKLRNQEKLSEVSFVFVFFPLCAERAAAFSQPSNIMLFSALQVKLIQPYYWRWQRLHIFQNFLALLKRELSHGGDHISVSIVEGKVGKGKALQLFKKNNNVGKQTVCSSGIKATNMKNRHKISVTNYDSSLIHHMVTWWWEAEQKVY